jgi:hypothetical protein
MITKERLLSLPVGSILEMDNGDRLVIVSVGNDCTTVQFTLTDVAAAELAACVSVVITKEI